MEHLTVLVCPLCKGPLGSRDGAYWCDLCDRRYPVLCGIPDFRILPDRYISIEDDRAKGQRLFEGSAGRGFADMLELYWSMTPDVPEDLVEKFKAHALAETAIAAATLAEVDGRGALLDVGCSTGGLLVAAACRFSSVVGVDVAFRWLVAGNVRLRETGVSAALICANAEYLPLAADAFGTVTANDLLEHVVDPARVFTECRRVTAPSGLCYFSTNNRYSLLPEPHVNVWGVGWLPRPLQAQYVRLMAGRSYRNICLRSAAELKKAGFAKCVLAPAPLSVPGRLASVHAVYNRMRRSVALSRLLCRVGPRLQLLCRK